jgi:hypothetical protein
MYRRRHPGEAFFIYVIFAFIYLYLTSFSVSPLSLSHLYLCISRRCHPGEVEEYKATKQSTLLNLCHITLPINNLFCLKGDGDGRRHSGRRRVGRPNQERRHFARGAGAAPHRVLALVVRRRARRPPRCVCVSLSSRHHLISPPSPHASSLSSLPSHLFPLISSLST